jgi:hypothetical protein
MTRRPAGGALGTVSGDMDQVIADALAAGWAWSVFSPLSSPGPLAWGIESSESAAVERVEWAMTHKPNAAFGGIARATADLVCRRRISGGLHWRRV